MFSEAALFAFVVFLILCVFSVFFFNLLFYLLNPIHHFIKLTIQPRLISCFFLNVKILKF